MEMGQSNNLLKVESFNFSIKNYYFKGKELNSVLTFLFYFHFT